MIKDEAMCIQKTLNWAIKNNINAAIIELDAFVVQAINSRILDNTMFGSIIVDCICLLNQRARMTLSHVYRSVNKLAYFLAQESIIKPGLHDCECSLPHASSLLLA